MLDWRHVPESYGIRAASGQLLGLVMRTDEVFDGEVAAVIKQAIRLVIEQTGGVAAEGIEFGHLSVQQRMKPAR